MAKFELYKDAARYWRWRFLASNGKIIADSAESYVRREDAEYGIRLVKSEAPTAPVVDLTQAATGYR